MRALLVACATTVFFFASPPAHAAAAPPPWYPPMLWLPANAENFDEGRAGTAITQIVIHATAGSYAGAVSWFRDPRSKVSAHYVIRNDGAITQMVAEKDTAFHARGSNRGTIGIEHEFDPASGVGFTNAVYRASARLVCAVTRRYGIPPDRAHIVGHSEVAGADHVDPGPSWDWSSYMALVRGCTAPAIPAQPLSFGSAGPNVTLLQQHLGRLGYMSAVTGYFGPVTEEAVRRFQSDHGIDPTGTYGPLTRGALVANAR